MRLVAALLAGLMRRMGGVRGAGPAAWFGALLLVSASAQAASTPFCDPGRPRSVAEQDRALRFAAQVRAELDASGHAVALISRAGLDLDRIGLRYSHAGIVLRRHAELPWAVRQLYFDCDTRRARLFDQGLAGFVLGSHDAALAFVSLVFVPDMAGRLERTTRDNATALALLGSAYSASAYAFSTQYQNCNQWVAELLATAWWGPSDGTQAPADPRAQAQAWLEQAGYAPARIQLGSVWWHSWASWIPWLHEDDHPPRHRAALRYDVSVPEALEAFVQAQQPQAQRVELCQSRTHIVIRRGWRALSSDCTAEAGDTVVQLD